MELHLEGTKSTDRQTGGQTDRQNKKYVVHLVLRKYPKEIPK